MRFYLLPSNNWVSLSNTSSKYYEIHRGYDKLKHVEITQIKSEGFGWDWEGKTLNKAELTPDQFKAWLKNRAAEYKYMLKRTREVLKMFDK